MRLGPLTSDGRRTLVAERKTTSEDLSIGSVYWKRLLLDVQVSTYVAAGRDLGIPITGVFYDVLRKPMQYPGQVPLADEQGVKIVLDGAGQRVRTKNDKKWRETGDAELGYTLQTRPETPSEYEARVLEAISEDPERYYQRKHLVRLEDELGEAELDAWQTASMIRDARRLNVFPKNPDGCFVFYRECDYMPICSRLSSTDDPMMYRVSPKRHEELDTVTTDNGFELLTQSEVRAYRRCPRYHQLRYEKRLRRLGDPADPLRDGSLTHGALEVWSKTRRDLSAALAYLERCVDPYVRAKIRAMVIGYHVMWEHEPIEWHYVEREYRLPLVNPETGAASRTFLRAGKLDGVVVGDFS